MKYKKGVMSRENFQHSRYKPHQGDREKARRVRWNEKADWRARVLAATTSEELDKVCDDLMDATKSRRPTVNTELDGLWSTINRRQVLIKAGAV